MSGPDGNAGHRHDRTRGASAGHGEHEAHLLGHWIEMRSVMGASRALEELARLMPSEAHKMMPDGSLRDVPISEIQPGDRILIRPGEKIPADAEVIRGDSVVAIPLAAGVLSGLGILLSPALGAVLMSLSTVIVSINARLLQVRV